MTIAFGFVNAVYGCIAQTAEEIYPYLNRGKGQLCALIEEGSTDLPLCDVAVIDTVATYLAVKSYLTSDMIVIVCDSAVALNTVAGLIPLDYTSKNLLVEFKLNAPSKAVSLKQPAIKVASKQTDNVMQAIKDIITSGLLGEFNTLTAKMNSAARLQLRKLLARLFFSQTTVSEIADYCQSLNVDASSFLTAISGRYFTNLSQAVIYYNKGHSLEYVMGKYGITDSYEITYFSKLLKGTK